MKRCPAGTSLQQNMLSLINKGGVQVMFLQGSHSLKDSIAILAHR